MVPIVYCQLERRDREQIKPEYPVHYPHGGFRNLKSYQMAEVVHHKLSDCRDCRRYKEDVISP